MPWWAWVLMAWGALGVALGVALGRVIRIADLRELGRHRLAEEREPGEKEPKERPRASSGPTRQDGHQRGVVAPAGRGRRAILLGRLPPGRACPATVLRVLRWICAAVVGTVLSGFAVLLVTGQHISDGPIVLPLTEAHGLHLRDVLVLLGWVVSMSMLVVLVATHQRCHDARRPAPIGDDGRDESHRDGPS